MNKILLFISVLLLILFITQLAHTELISGSGGNITGNVSSGAADSGNPIKIGGVFNTTPPLLTTGQRGNAQADNRGSLFVTIGSSASPGSSAEVTNIAADAQAAGAIALFTKSALYNYNGSTWDRIRHSFTQSTTGITTNAAGTSVNITTTPMSKFTMAVIRTAGTTDVLEVDFEGSLDNSNFFELGTIVTVIGGKTMVHVADKPVAYMRYNVIAVGTGNTLSIQLLASGR